MLNCSAYNMRTRHLLVAAAVLSALLAVSCGRYQGLYRDRSGTISLDLHKGKARLSLGAYTIEGTYKLDGNKIIATGNFGPLIPNPCIFTLNDDGSLDGPPGSMILHLQKVPPQKSR
jgi:hypothetical protein